MKSFIVVICMLVAVVLGEVQPEERFCDATAREDLSDMKKSCTDQLKVQILKEVEASVTYLSMAAHFSKDTVNLPGFAKFFFDSAKEEREHAMHLIHYLTMRGELSTNSSGFIEPLELKVVARSGVIALKKALDLEKSVTRSIRNVIEVCEDDKAGERNEQDVPFNDYHLVDYLTGVYLEEQYKGQRELAGRSVTLQNMVKSYGEMGIFLFDKTLL